MECRPANTPGDGVVPDTPKRFTGLACGWHVWEENTAAQRNNDGMHTHPRRTDANVLTHPPQLQQLLELSNTSAMLCYTTLQYASSTLAALANNQTSQMSVLTYEPQLQQLLKLSKHVWQVTQPVSAPDGQNP